MLSEQIIAKLENAGFKRWTKGNHDRMYVNADTLGLECDFYKHSGRVCDSSFNGEIISHRIATDMLAAKTYVDVKTGSVYSTNYTLGQAAQDFLDRIMDEE